MITVRKVEGEKAMSVSMFDHIAHVCHWHNNEKQAPPIGPDRKWAKKWLDEQERNGTLTAAEAREIRQREGWHWSEQLELFAQEAAP
jgi:hypothetical protein